MQRAGHFSSNHHWNTWVSADFPGFGASFCAVSAVAIGTRLG
jgi:hypothetical protein